MIPIFRYPNIHYPNNICKVPMGLDTRGLNVLTTARVLFNHVRIIFIPMNEIGRRVTLLRHKIKLKGKCQT